MSGLVVVSEEVRSALDEGRAVVALETTLVAHGFPAPEGVEVGLESERRVRAAGAVPATVGVLDGRIRIGLDADALERFTPEARKCGARDLAAAAVQGAVGATTVGGTLAAARGVAIRFLGTGGLGGVHRDWAESLDVSADLVELSRAPVVVVSSGGLARSRAEWRPSRQWNWAIWATSSTVRTRAETGGPPSRA